MGRCCNSADHLIAHATATEVGRNRRTQCAPRFYTSRIQGVRGMARDGTESLPTARSEKEAEEGEEVGGPVSWHC